MAAMSDYLEVALINHIFRGTAYTAALTLGIALASVALTDTDTTLVGKEIAVGSYARVPLISATTSWSAVTTSGTTSNSSSIVFPTCTADWNTVSYVAICDNITTAAGNVLFYGALASIKVVLNGDTFQFNALALTVQLDN